MKRSLLLLLLPFSLCCFAQKEKWSVALALGMGVGGPSPTIKKQMEVQGFNQTADFNFLGWSGSTGYPKKQVDPSILLRITRTISSKKTLFIIAGRREKGSVKGFMNQGSTSMLGIISGSYGPQPTIQYSTYELTAGYLYNTKSSIRVGLGPTVFLVPYKLGNAASGESKYSSVMAGASFTARVPLGKARKPVGLELFFDAQLAPPIKMKIEAEKADGFHMQHANMM